MLAAKADSPKLLSHFCSPHKFVTDGREEVLRIHADKADGKRSAAEVDGGGTGEGEASRVHAEGERIQVAE